MEGEDEEERRSCKHSPKRKEEIGIEREKKRKFLNLTNSDEGRDGYEERVTEVG